MNTSALYQKVNFSLAVALMGSAALLGITLMLQAAELENPLIERVVFAEEL